MAEEVPSYDGKGADRRASATSGVADGLALEGDAAVLGMDQI